MHSTVLSTSTDPVRRGCGVAMAAMPPAVAPRTRGAVPGDQPTWEPATQQLVDTLSARWSSSPVDVQRYFDELAHELGDGFHPFIKDMVWSSGLAVSAGATRPALPEPELEPEPEPEPKPKPEPNSRAEPGPEPKLQERELQAELDGESDPVVRSMLQENQTLRRKVAERDKEIGRIRQRLAEVQGVAAPRPKSATARPRSAPAVSSPPRKLERSTSGRRPASARRAAKHSRIYARDLERRAARDAATAAAREQQVADEMKEATFSPRTTPRLPSWYRRVNPSINLRPRSEIRAAIRAPSKPTALGTAVSARSPSGRRPLRQQQPQACTKPRVRGKQTDKRPRSREVGNKAIGIYSAASKAPKAGLSMHATEPTQTVATAVSELPLEPPNTAELEQLGWGTKSLDDGQQYWWALSEPAVLHWGLPSTLSNALRALRDGSMTNAPLASLPSSAAELNTLGTTSTPYLGNMMAALGVS